MDHDKKGGGDAQGCRVVFSDIDGTLLDSSHQVTRATREEIRKLERQGIPFVLVSARMPEAMTTIQAQIGIHSPMVCYSGALVVGEEGEYIHSCQIKLHKAAKIKHMLDQDFPSICCNTYGGSKWAVDDVSDPWVRREAEITTLKVFGG